MNGISSNLKEEIKKSREFKHKEKFKFIAAILVTNIFVALMCLPEHKKVDTPKKAQKSLHKDHQIIIIPLSSLIGENEKDSPETLVTLVNRNKKVIVPKAYLHEEVEKTDGTTQFKVEIPSGDLIKVSDLLDEGVLAIPYMEMEKAQVYKKRGSKYEINL